MKKIALLLAVVMLLTCCFVMASCGDDKETSSEASKAESAAESKAESKEESKAESAAESKEETTEEPAESSEEPAESSEEPTPGDEQVFFVTHFNDGFSEGAGAIFTQEDTAGGWWIHVSFKPVEGKENGWEIVEIVSQGLADGTSTPLAIPEGGFVWASNYGNDWTTINPDDPEAINYVNETCTNAIQTALTWKVGDQFVINGLDLEGENVPTSTPDLKWYDANYVCTSTYAPLA